MSHEVAGRWTYHDDARKRPFLHPVRTPSGAELTRNAPEDHPWHHGLWFTIKFVNGENFWEEYDAYGVLRHVGDLEVREDSLAGTVHWVRPDRETVVLVDERRLTHVELAEAAYAIDISITIAPQTDVVLDTTPFTTWGGYGGLALRGRPDWSDTRILLADGTEHQRVLGVPSAWCDLSGTVDDGDHEGEGGMLFLVSPDNLRSPVPWYGSTKADNYGTEGWSNFLNAAFLWDGPLEVSAGARLAFDYRVVVHDGRWDVARCAAEWDRWRG